MAGDEASVSVAFTADDADLESALADMAESASATAEQIKEAFADMSADVDEDLEGIKLNVDDLKSASFEIKGGVDDNGADTKLGSVKDALEDIKKDSDFAIKGTVDANGADTKLGDIKDALEDIKRDPDFAIKGTLSDDEAATKLHDVSEALGDINKDPKFAITGTVDDDGADTKLDTISTSLEDIKRDPDFAIKGDVEDNGTDTKLEAIKALKDDLDDPGPTIRPKVSDKDDAEATAKLLGLKALTDALDKTTVINVTIKDTKGRSGLSADEIAKDVETKLDEDLSTGGAGKKGGDGIGKKIADNLADGIGDAVEGAMTKTLIASALMPFADEIGGVLAGGLASMITAAIGGAAFGLALTGQSNPVTAAFKTKLDNALTNYDKAMAPYTSAALASLLNPITAWLNDAGPLVSGFASGLTSFGQEMTGILDQKGVKDLFTQLGQESGQSMKALGPMMGEFLVGFGQLLVEAAPLMTEVDNLMTSVMGSFASKSTGKDEGKLFQNLANDMKTFAPEVGTLLGQMGSDIGQFMTDIKPLEGVALKGVSNGLLVVGQMLKGLEPVISDISWALGEVEKMPGGGELTGVATLLLASKTIRGIMGDLISAGADKGLDALGGKLKSIGQIITGTGKNTIPGAAATMQEAADEMMSAARLMGGKGAGGDVPPLVTAGEGAGELTLAALAPLLALAGAMALTLTSDEGSNPTDAQRALAKADLGGKISGKEQSSIQEQLAAFFGTTAGSGLEPGVKFAKGASVYTDIAANPQMAAALLAIAKSAMSSGLKDPFSLQEQITAEKTLGLDGGKGGTFSLAKVTPKELEADLKKALANLPKEGKNAGENVVSSLNEGVKGKSKSAGEAAKTMASDVVAAVKKEFGISSPSTVFAAIGKDNITGLDNGMVTKSKDLMTEGKQISTNLVSVFKDAQPLMVTQGQDAMLSFVQGMKSEEALVMSTAQAIAASAVSAMSGVGSVGSGSAHAANSTQVTFNGPLVEVVSLTGTLPPQVMQQVEQAVETGLSQVLGVGSSALRTM